MRDIGKNIKNFRLQNNMSQEEMAEKLFVTRQTISNYETGKSRPDIDTLVRIADIYGTDVNKLIYGEKKYTKEELRKKTLHICAAAGLIIILGICIAIFDGISRNQIGEDNGLLWRYIFIYVIRPVFSTAIGTLAVHILSQIVIIKPFRKETLGRKISKSALYAVAVVTAIWAIIAILNLLSGSGIDMRWMGSWMYIVIMPVMGTVFFITNWYCFIAVGLVAGVACRLTYDRK